MPEKATTEVLGISFRIVAAIEPERNLDGTVKKFLPQRRYTKAAETALNAWGHGPFCQFRVHGLPVNSGVYLLRVGSRTMYVGIGSNLAERFGPRGYGTIHPRNCYVGGQSTNCKVNHLVLRSTVEGGAVEIWIHETATPRPIEGNLIRSLRPPWNAKVPWT